MHVVYRLRVYWAILCLPLITSIACSTPFHNYLLAWNPNGKELAVQGQDVTIFDENLRTTTLVSDGHNYSHSNSLGWNPMGNQLIWLNDTGAYIWQEDTNKVQQILVEEPNLSMLDWSPDGKWVATNGNRRIVIWATDLWKRDVVLQDADNPNEQFTSVAWNPDGTLLAGGTASGKIQIWEMQNKKLIHTISTAMKTITALAWNPDNNAVVAVGGYPSSQVYLWNAKTGTLDKTFNATKSEMIVKIEYSPNAKLIAVGASDGVKIFDAAQYQETLSFPYESGMLTSVMWSPNSSKIALAGNLDIVQVWDITTGKLLAEHNMDR